MRRKSGFGRWSLLLILLWTASGCQPAREDTWRVRSHTYAPAPASWDNRPSEQPTARQNNALIYHATKAVWNSNDRVYEVTKRKARAGDPEAQRWMARYGVLYEMTRNWSRAKNEEWNRPRE